VEHVCPPPHAGVQRETTALKSRTWCIIEDAWGGVWNLAVGDETASIRHQGVGSFRSGELHFAGPTAFWDAMATVTCAVRQPPVRWRKSHRRLVRTSNVVVATQHYGLIRRTGPIRQSRAGLLSLSIQTGDDLLRVQRPDVTSLLVRALSTVSQLFSAPWDRANLPLDDSGWAASPEDALAQISDSWRLEGDPVERVVAAAARDGGWRSVPRDDEDVWEIPFDYASATCSESAWCGTIDGRRVMVRHPLAWRGGWVTAASLDGAAPAPGAGGSALEAIHMALFRCGVLAS